MKSLAIIIALLAIIETTACSSSVSARAPAGVDPDCQGPVPFDEESVRRHLPQSIERTFGPVLASMHMPPEELDRVKALLVKRVEARRDAQRMSGDAHMSVSDQNAAVAQAEAQVNNEILASVGLQFYEQIKDMVSVQSELDEVELNYADPMASAGAPLTDAQPVALAKVLKNVYSDAEAHASFNAAAYRAYRAENIDPNTGLSNPDREAMRQAAVFLSPAQLSVLQAKLAAITSGFVRRVEEKQKRASLSQSNPPSNQ